ncbi:MAG: hypothetical protein H7Y01_05340, partial [Ferruginibacter sp.]|nr:hypothetical protein [Chitinophagaceae bacterium]
MSRKKNILFSIFLLIVLSGKTQPVTPKPFVEKPRKVKMPKYFVAELPKKSVPLTGIEVMQAVWDSTRLGYLQKGLINIKAEALPATNLTDFLQEYITKQYEDGYKKTGSSLLIFVKELRINERTFFSSEYAFTRLSADAWISADAIKYRQVAGIDTVISWSSMGDVTSAQGENIARGLYHLVLTALKNAGLNNFIPGPEMTAAEINARERQRFNIPILTAPAFKEGAYMDFREFLQNNPAVPSFELTVLDKRKVKIESILENSARKEIIPWGICKEGEIYKYHEQELIPIEKNNDGFIISDYLEKSHRRNGSIFLSTFFGSAFGLVGGVVSAGVASS